MVSVKLTREQMEHGVTWPPVYKYCKREHMQGMLDRGSVRLGSLSEYRKAEGPMVGDRKDGTKKVQGAFAEVRDIAQYPRLREMGLHFNGPVSNVVVANTELWTPDQFVFSMSARYSRSAHRRWRDKEGYDACYRIDNPFRFLEAIHAIIGDEFRRGDYGPVAYMDIEDLTVAAPGEDPAFVKQMIFSDQNEVRATYWPRDRRETVVARVIAASEAGRYCSVQAVL